MWRETQICQSLNYRPSPSITERWPPCAESISPSSPANCSPCSGANGAGKTTAVRILLGLTSPTSGTRDPLRTRSRQPRGQTAPRRPAASRQSPGDHSRPRTHRTLLRPTTPSRCRSPRPSPPPDCRASRTASSAISPAARNSASSSPSPSAATPTCYSSTNPPSGSTSKRAAPCGSTSAASSRAAAASCSPPTIWTRPTRSPTASP